MLNRAERTATLSHLRITGLLILRNLSVGRRSFVPAVDRRTRGSTVERRIDLDGVKLAGVVGEIVSGFQLGRIERTRPTRSGKRRSAEAESAHEVGAFDGLLFGNVLGGIQQIERALRQLDGLFRVHVSMPRRKQASP